MILNILALIGIIISGYIFYKKLRNEKLVCILGDACDAVVKSKYSSFMGIPNEFIGIIYYLSIIFLVPFSQYLNIPPQFYTTALLAASLMAFLYSVYLSYTQLAVLKQICEYCLVANICNGLIFIIVVIGLTH